MVPHGRAGDNYHRHSSCFYVSGGSTSAATNSTVGMTWSRSALARTDRGWKPVKVCQAPRLVPGPMPVHARADGALAQDDRHEGALTDTPDQFAAQRALVTC
jgi:hypothetical protein